MTQPSRSLIYRLQKPACPTFLKCLFVILTACGCLIVQACSEPVSTPVVEDLPSTNNLKFNPNCRHSAPDKKPVSVSASHILCSYQGALKARRDINRTRKQAAQRANHLHLLACDPDANFEDLVKMYSDDSKSNMREGDLGTIYPGELHPDLESALFNMGIGQISDVTESPKGYHILYRKDPNEAQAAEILISYQGAKRYTPRQPRTRNEARLLADQILERLQLGSSFEDEALAFSDLPNHVRGGFHKIFTKTSQHPKFEEAVWALQYGELSKVVETETGFHIVKRLPVHKIQVRKILIGYKAGIQDEPLISENTMRTKAESFQLAEKVKEMADQPQSDFSALAFQFSEGPKRDQLGLMRPFGRGQIDYQIERAAFSLQAGQISDVVECEEGHAIIKRIR